MTALPPIRGYRPTGHFICKVCGQERVGRAGIAAHMRSTHPETATASGLPSGERS